MTSFSHANTKTELVFFAQFRERGNPNLIQGLSVHDNLPTQQQTVTCEFPDVVISSTVSRKVVATNLLQTMV